ncbi:MAG: hypothetical protein JWL84_5494 [Rhodospirillales bacterium]|nr:hypothetical protein [Rhodospirillales bacterium]
MRVISATGIVLVAAASLVAAAAAGNAKDLVVVEASGVALKAGQLIDDTQPLVLEDGQRVTLIAGNGATLKIRGPYNQPPTSASTGDAGVSDALKTLIVQKDTRTSDVGVVRGAQGAKLPEPWLLDVTRAGSLCIRGDDRVVVWRSPADAAAIFSITPLDRSWKMTASWPAGVDRLVLPDTFPRQVRSTYLVELDEAKNAVTINSIPTAVDSNAMRAAWMIEKGCLAQATALISELH